MPPARYRALYEAALCATPNDLIAIFDENERFRKAMDDLPEEASTLWMTSLQRLPGFPQCPESLDAEQVARLLFESSCCHICDRVLGRDDAVFVSFQANSKFCELCAKDASNWEPKVDRRVLDRLISVAATAFKLPSGGPPISYDPQIVYPHVEKLYKEYKSEITKRGKEEWLTQEQNRHQEAEEFAMAYLQHLQDRKRSAHCM